MRDMLLVLNFDNDASRAITRKLRSERVFCKIVPGSVSLEEIRAHEPLGLLLAGGVSGQTPTGLDSRIPLADIPILALGDAAGLLLSMLGGTVGDIAYQGAVMPVSYADCPLLAGMESGERMLPCVREFHLPGQIRPVISAQETVIGYAHESLPLYGAQLQIEQNDPESSLILRNFALNICGCTSWWDDDAFVTRAVEEIRRVSGDGRVVCAMTGGLDSGVSALLAHKALGNRLKCIFVDTGLLRAREGDEFIAYYRDEIGLDITRISAQARFLDALRGIKDAAEKRRVIIRLIQDILREEEEKMGPITALVRGTSCNDIMYGGGALCPALGEHVQLIEPLRELFKDEIRRIADFLAIPADLISRQPFPGSGLALRVLGEVTEERLNTLRAADALFRGELLRSSAAKRLWQYFAVLIPMPGCEEKSVICLRAVHAAERSLTYAARLPYDVMENVTDLILRDQKSVCRVTYDLTPAYKYSGVEWQ
ncbi:MAG: hypothetical protein IJP78_00445 [Clostridia bacterium]|nr:hypothetical protein [Clostridia bacterium]